MHEEPNILHFGRPGTGMKLHEGMVFTIEPMLNQGSRKVATEKDGWTVVTRDGKLSAQFEHTVAVTETGVEVLTLRRDGRGYGEGVTPCPLVSTEGGQIGRASGGERVCQYV